MGGEERTEGRNATSGATSDEKYQRKNKWRTFYFILFFLLISFPSRASRAAIALRSWAAKISHIADACISSARLSCHVSNPADSRLPFTTGRGPGVCERAALLCATACVCARESAQHFGGIRKRSRQRETSARGSRSGYSLRLASETGMEKGAGLVLEISRPT